MYPMPPPPRRSASRCRKRTPTNPTYISICSYLSIYVSIYLSMYIYPMVPSPPGALGAARVASWDALRPNLRIYLYIAIYLSIYLSIYVLCIMEIYIRWPPPPLPRRLRAARVADDNALRPSLHIYLYSHLSIYLSMINACIPCLYIYLSIYLSIYV